MRSNLVLVVLVASLATLACKREDAPPSTEPEAATTAVAEPELEPEPAAGPDLQAMCEHSLPIMRVGLGLDDVELTPEEQETTMSECVRGLEEKQATTPPEEFAAKSECILKTATMDELIACG
jgi:hypothetical protein